MSRIEYSSISWIHRRTAHSFFLNSSASCVTSYTTLDLFVWFINGFVWTFNLIICLSTHYNRIKFPLRERVKFLYTWIVGARTFFKMQNHRCDLCDLENEVRWFDILTNFALCPWQTQTDRQTERLTHTDRQTDFYQEGTFQHFPAQSLTDWGSCPVDEKYHI